jgi:hypothetical protein
MSRQGDPPWRDRAIIEQPRAIHLLTDRRALRHLRPFMLGEHTLTTAARETSEPASTLAYWIPKFLGAGLVERLRDLPRAGMRSPRYRAVARELVVPFAAIPIDRRVALLDEARLVLLRRFVDGVEEALAADRSFRLGFTADPDGFTSVHIVETPAEAAKRSVTEGWHVVRLTDARARELSAELEAVIARYTDDRSGRPHILHVGVAPEPRVKWRSATEVGGRRPGR